MQQRLKLDALDALDAIAESVSVTPCAIENQFRVQKLLRLPSSNLKKLDIALTRSLGQHRNAIEGVCAEVKEN